VCGRKCAPLYPFRFTGKELDRETGLYYYGARYLNPQTGLWLSVDPAMGEYIPRAPVNDETKKYNENLPGMGGAFNYINLHAYHYAGNNPVKLTDPNGNSMSIPLNINASAILRDKWEPPKENWKRGVDMSIMLYVCEAGTQTYDGRDSYAQELADALGPGSTVIAPDKKLWTYSSGMEPTINSSNPNNVDMPNLEDPGNWITFTGR
jgi:RHS repeat-associated protein